MSQEIHPLCFVNGNFNQFAMSSAAPWDRSESTLPPGSVRLPNHRVKIISFGNPRDLLPEIPARVALVVHPTVFSLFSSVAAKEAFETSAVAPRKLETSNEVIARRDYLRLPETPAKEARPRINMPIELQKGQYSLKPGKTQNILASGTFKGLLPEEESVLEITHSFTLAGSKRAYTISCKRAFQRVFGPLARFCVVREKDVKILEGKFFPVTVLMSERKEA